MEAGAEPKFPNSLFCVLSTIPSADSRNSFSPMFSAILYSFGNVFGGSNQIYFEKKAVYFKRERVLLLKLHLSSYVFLLLVCLLRRLSNSAFIDNKAGAVSRGDSCRTNTFGDSEVKEKRGDLWTIKMLLAFYFKTSVACLSTSQCKMAHNTTVRNCPKLFHF